MDGPDYGESPDGSQQSDLLIERLLRVIDEGRRTATYKLALLSALIDAVALTPGESDVPTRLLAERVLALYYPQTRQYVADDGIAPNARMTRRVPPARVGQGRAAYRGL